MQYFVGDAFWELLFIVCLMFSSFWGWGFGPWINSHWRFYLLYIFYNWYAVVFSLSCDGKTSLCAADHHKLSLACWFLVVTWASFLKLSDILSIVHSITTALSRQLYWNNSAFLLNIFLCLKLMKISMPPQPDC